MDNLPLKFFYRHYTECFCHVKKLVVRLHDTKISPVDAQVLKYIDSSMRENSYTGGVLSGFLTSCVAGIIVSVNTKRDFSRVFFFARAGIAIAMVLNINKCFNWGSHFGILFGLPRIYQLLLEGAPETSFVHQETKEFLLDILKEESK